MIPLFGRLKHNRCKVGQSQLVLTMTPNACACSQELEHFHIHQVLPISVPRILATHHTTMMNGDGGCRCKGGQHFLRFYLSNAKEANVDDGPRDCYHSASNVLLGALAYPVHRYGLISRTSSKRSDFGNIKIHKEQLVE